MNDKTEKRNLRNSPIFNPVTKREFNYYHPENKSAILITTIRHNLEDIVKRIDMYSFTEDKYSKTLQIKDILIEYLSVYDNITIITNKILKNDVEFPIEKNALSLLREKYSEFKEVQKSGIPLKQWKIIRGKIAAHHDPMDLLTVAEYVDQATNSMDDIVKKLNSSILLYNFLKDINIYTWYKQDIDENGNIVNFATFPLQDMAGRYVGDIVNNDI